MSYFESISKELDALKDRVRYLIHHKHHLSDGEWKESILRSVLKKHLPIQSAIGKGFFVSLCPETGEPMPSTQIDLLIYDSSMPVLFRDGDFVIVTPDCVKAIIEVKTRLNSSIFKKSLKKLQSNNAQLKKATSNRPFIGLFSYDVQPSRDDYKNYLAMLPELSHSFADVVIHASSIGKDYFIRHWEVEPENPRIPCNKWHLYKLDNMAQAYFIHNVIEYMHQVSFINNNELWYPKFGKEKNIIDVINNLEPPL